MNAFTEFLPHDASPTMQASSTAPQRWGHAFASLGPTFFTQVQPQALPQPYWVGRSASLARELGWSEWMDSPEALAILTGNALPRDAQPLASVYSGHQFGVWAGQLGDGRALLLGDVTDAAGTRQEIQLKGAGLTPYSRRADGRAVLRSSIREFLCSEAMHGLGIPTTRALCITGSDEPVYRESIETAAVVTRVAPSFLRFGHFEHFAYQVERASEGDPAWRALRQLAEHAIDQHYPECRDSAALEGNPYAALLQAVSERTARLMAQWQAVGFCHGVMNTDNMSLLGLTLDYGPFQFLDVFDPAHVCNHSDTHGRYAYQRQPSIAFWNLMCLGQALLPLIGSEALALQALESYKTVFPETMTTAMRAKLGLHDAQASDLALVDTLLKLLARDRVDYTIFWRRLSHWVGQAQPMTDARVSDVFVDRAGIGAWLERYLARLGSSNRNAASQAMLRVNPKFVLRNHLAETAIRKAREKDFSEVATLLELLQSPFDEHPGFESYADFAPDWAAHLEISCSS